MPIEREKEKARNHKVASFVRWVSSIDIRRCPPADAGGMAGARENGHEGGR